MNTVLLGDHDFLSGMRMTPPPMTSPFLKSLRGLSFAYSNPRASRAGAMA